MVGQRLILRVECWTEVLRDYLALDSDHLKVCLLLIRVRDAIRIHIWITKIDDKLEIFT